MTHPIPVRTFFTLILAFSQWALALAPPTATVIKTKTEQKLKLPQISAEGPSVAIEIDPADSTLKEERLISLAEGKLWIGIWHEGNRGRHLRAWIYSNKDRRWFDQPLADVTSDLKISEVLEGQTLKIQTFKLQDNEQLEAQTPLFLTVSGL